MKTSFLYVITLAAILAVFTLSAAANPFFAFDNGVGRGEWTPKQQAQTLAELGYAGIGYSGLDDLDARRAAFDAQGLKIFNLYVGCHLDKEPAYDATAYKEAIGRLKGTDTMLWFTVQGSGPEKNDDKAVELIREVAGFAADAGIKVALYPHYGFYVADLDDAIRISKKVNRDNVGVTFNLCHELRGGNESRFDELLERAVPKLFLVSINGADHDGDWDRLIQPLGRGAFDVYAVLKKLELLGYRGPIGLQCYNIKGDVRENLLESIAQWKKYETALSGHGPDSKPKQ